MVEQCFLQDVAWDIVLQIKIVLNFKNILTDLSPVFLDLHLLILPSKNTQVGY